MAISVKNAFFKPAVVNAHAECKRHLVS